MKVRLSVLFSIISLWGSMSEIRANPADACDPSHPRLTVKAATDKYFKPGQTRYVSQPTRIVERGRICNLVTGCSAWDENLDVIFFGQKWFSRDWSEKLKTQPLDVQIQQGEIYVKMGWFGCRIPKDNEPAIKCDYSMRPESRLFFAASNGVSHFHGNPSALLSSNEAKVTAILTAGCNQMEFSVKSKPDERGQYFEGSYLVEKIFNPTEQ